MNDAFFRLASHVSEELAALAGRAAVPDLDFDRVLVHLRDKRGRDAFNAACLILSRVRRGPGLAGFGVSLGGMVEDLHSGPPGFGPDDRGCHRYSPCATRADEDPRVFEARCLFSYHSRGDYGAILGPPSGSYSEDVVDASGDFRDRWLCSLRQRLLLVLPHSDWGLCRDILANLWVAAVADATPDIEALDIAVDRLEESGRTIDALLLASALADIRAVLGARVDLVS